jgi:hypothetical protein
MKLKIIVKDNMYDSDDKEDSIRILFGAMENTAINAEKQFCKAFGQIHGENLAYCTAVRFLEEECHRAESILIDLGLDDVDCLAIIGDFDGYRKAMEEKLSNNFDIDELFD